MLNEKEDAFERRHARSDTLQPAARFDLIGSSTSMAASLALRSPTLSMGKMRSPLPIGLQIASYAVILLYAIFFQVTRGLGNAALALVIACTFLIWASAARWYVQRLLFWYALLAGVYLLFSWADLLHWNTLLFDRGAILQQSIYAFLLPTLVPIFAYYHERVFSQDRPFIVLDNFLILACVAGKVFYALSVHSLTGLAVIQFFNIEGLFAFFLVRRVYYEWQSLVVRVITVIFFAATAGSFQSVLVGLFLIGILVAPSFGRVGLLCFTLGLVAISIAAVPFADAIWNIDPNTGIRLFYWRDAIHRLVESYGVGQGFGTETIRPLYQLSSYDVTIATPDQSEFILIGSHNAFVDAGYRMGVLGMGILVVYISTLFRSVMRVVDPSRAFDFFVCALLFTLLMVNVGLASINFLFGASFLMGWLAFRRSIGFLDPHALAASASRISHPVGRGDSRGAA